MANISSVGNPARRVLFIAAVLAALASHLPAGASTERVEEQSYVSAGIFVAGHGNLVGQHGQHMIIPEDSTPVVFRPRAGERSVTFEVADDVSPVPVVYVRQADASGGHMMETDMCEKTVSINLMSTKPVKVWVLNGFCRNHNWGAATSGTIQANFSKS